MPDERFADAARYAMPIKIMLMRYSIDYLLYLLFSPMMLLPYAMPRHAEAAARFMRYMPLYAVHMRLLLPPATRRWYYFSIIERDVAATDIIFALRCCRAMFSLHARCAIIDYATIAIIIIIHYAACRYFGECCRRHYDIIDRWAAAACCRRQHAGADATPYAAMMLSDICVYATASPPPAAATLLSPALWLIIRFAADYTIFLRVAAAAAAARCRWCAMLRFWHYFLPCFDFRLLLLSMIFSPTCLLRCRFRRFSPCRCRRAVQRWCCVHYKIISIADDDYWLLFSLMPIRSAADTRQRRRDDNITPALMLPLKRRCQRDDYAFDFRHKDDIYIFSLIRWWCCHCRRCLPPLRRVLYFFAIRCLRMLMRERV